MSLNQIINGIKKGYEYNNQYFALALRVDNRPTVEVSINHYSAMDEKLEYIVNTYNKNGKHKYANVIIEDFAVARDFEDIQINLGLKEVGF